ncbi:MAG: YtxH domain-containing protein [Nitrospira sp.]|nr:YtxH domain-containing protein [Nitrospira sp.]
MGNGNYYERQTDTTGWSTFLAGALIGAGVALLFAPQRGSELRGLLQNYANRAKDDLMDKGQEAWDTAVERGEEYYNRGEEAIRDAGRSAKEFAREGQEAMKDAGRSAKEFAKQGKNAVEEAANEATGSRR